MVRWVARRPGGSEAPIRMLGWPRRRQSRGTFSRGRWHLAAGLMGQLVRPLREGVRHVSSTPGCQPSGTQKQTLGTPRLACFSRGAVSQATPPGIPAGSTEAAPKSPTDTPEPISPGRRVHGLQSKGGSSCGACLEATSEKRQVELHPEESGQRHCSSIRAQYLITAQRCPVWPALLPA